MAIIPHRVSRANFPDRIDRAFDRMLRAKSANWRRRWCAALSMLIRARNAARTEREILRLEAQRGIIPSRESSQ